MWSCCRHDTASEWTRWPADCMMKLAVMMADLDLMVAGSSRDSSGPRVVMIPERRRPRQTKTSTMLAGVDSSSLMTQDSVGSTKSV